MNIQNSSSAALRKRRHQLACRLPPIEQILRGSLIETYKRCGRPNCHCVDGTGHGPKRYLSTISRTGERPRVGYVPNAAHAEVCEFLANFRKLREMLNEVCAINVAALIICSWVAAAMLLGRGQNCNARKRRDKLRQKLETLGEGLITS